ncbi:signal peptidase I [Sediminibacillus massiliensis]|uniref:signal peptidase I n=1 Tax=Sediminibacillus massiliensis TaxID=1926277 RepID=UPI00098894F6|nr:signal peptidase I [Sediminibacillus massiliensis]
MQVNAKTCLIIKEIIKKRGWVELPAQGTSMFPVIQEGDICRFVSCETKNLQKGDIILFQDSTGKLVTHRYVKSYEELNEQFYLFKGDTNLGLDAPIAKDKIIGKLFLIKKKKTVKKASSLSLVVWGAVIIRCPIVSGWLRSYLNKKTRKAVANL